MSLMTDRINQRMKDLGINHAQIMKGTGAGKSTVSGWLSGANDPSAKYLKQLAEVLKTTTSWLLDGIEDDTSSRFGGDVDLSSIASVATAPVISWVQAGNWTDMQDFINLQDCERLPLVLGAGRRSFYLIVRGLSNAPEFEEGERICIDPDWQLEDIQTGEMVVVSCNGKATFKALISEPDGYYLKPLNPDWQPSIMPLDEDCVLVGKYVGSFKPAKRFNLR